MVPANASEVPQATINSIIDYMNSPRRQWKGGEKYRFTDPHDCNPYFSFNGVSKVYCKVNTEEESVLGKRVCRSRTLTYTYPSAEETDRYSVEGGECSDWEKVAEMPPEPQPEPSAPAQLSPAQPAPKPTPAADTPTYTRTQLAISGGTIFLVGGLFGAVLGLTARKRKEF